MTTDEYLKAVLNSQNLLDDSPEMTGLREHRNSVEALLRDAFGSSDLTIKYGGSMAKGTLVRESYDLDLVCYFASEDDVAGATLRDIFDNVRKALEPIYSTDPKTSAIRLRSRDMAHTDFHIDVVPGRFTDESRTDCYLYQNGVEKERLKTNLKIHIEHIRNAGVTPALRLLKLWRVRQGLSIKNFVWELLCIKLLEGRQHQSLESQVRHVLESVATSEEAIVVHDPANPHGNDVMTFLRQVWWNLQSATRHTLNFTLPNGGWEGVFGAVESLSADDRRAALVKAAAVAQPTKPWAA